MISGGIKIIEKNLENLIKLKQITTRKKQQKSVRLNRKKRIVMRRQKERKKYGIRNS